MAKTGPDPLLECLIVLGQHYGESTTREALTAGLPLENQRLVPSLFARSAERIGLKSRIFQHELEKINPSLLPAVLILKDANACVVKRISEDRQKLSVVYPEHDTPVDVSFSDLKKQYAGYVIFARPRFVFDRRSPDLNVKRTGHWLWNALKENIPVYRDVLFAAFLINLFAIAIPLFTMNVYDRVIPNSAFETLWVLAVGAGIVVVADVVLRTIRGYYLDLASKRVDIKLSSDIMAKVLGLRLESRPVSAGSFAANLRSFETIRDFITSATITAIIDLPFTAIFLLLLMWIAGPMVIPSLVAILIILLYALSTQKRMEVLTERTYRAGSLRNATLIESLVGLDTLKSMSAEGIMQKRWEQSASFLAAVSVKLRLLASTNVNVVMWVQQWVTIAVVITGVYLIGVGELSMGGLIAASMLSARAMTPLNAVAGLLTQWHQAKTAYKSLNEIMDMPVERPTGERLVHRHKLKGRIEFRNVSFSYPDAENLSLKNVSFTMEPGERVALLGRIGSGKSTLHKLILGLYQPTEGAVLIDGIDVRQVDLAELRQQIGYVSQDITLFYGNLRENLTLGNPQLDDEAVIRAAEFAHLLDFINTHPKGFDMPVGERGESLSGGQRKSVALARAVINNPQILLLDEPTGSMDHSTESWVNKKLASFSVGRTMLVVTHRTSLLSMVDRIVVIDNGQIVADGPRENVIEALREGRIGRVA